MSETGRAPNLEEMDEQEAARFLTELATNLSAEKEYALRHEGYVMEMPQSGERIRGRENMRAFQQAYADRSNPPTIRLRRVIVRENLWVAESVVDYGGQVFHGVAVLELRDGKVWRDTRYFAEPFEAPAWRSRWSSGWKPAEREAEMHADTTNESPTLRTERLDLRPLATTDLDALYRISNEPSVRLYLWDDEPVAEATVGGLIAQSVRMFSEEGIGLFGVRLRGSNDLLGFCGFVRLEGMEEPELGYELTQEVWGRGLATEAARACLRHAFEEAGLERVIAGADAPNGASLRVIEKLGMKPVGNLNPNAPNEPYHALREEDFFAKVRRREI